MATEERSRKQWQTLRGDARGGRCVAAAMAIWQQRKGVGGGDPLKGD